MCVGAASLHCTLLCCIRESIYQFEYGGEEIHEHAHLYSVLRYDCFKPCERLLVYIFCVCYTVTVFQYCFWPLEHTVYCVLRTTSAQMPLLAITRHEHPLSSHLLSSLASKQFSCPEGGGRIYFQNVYKISHTRMAKKSKNRTNSV